MVVVSGGCEVVVVVCIDSMRLNDCVEACNSMDICYDNDLE